MSLYKNKYRIESARLRNYDYSRSGYYFITSCTYKRESLFGRVTSDRMILNQYGMILNDCWFDLPNHYINLKLEIFIIMPDHFHGIMKIIGDKSSARTGNKYEIFEFVRALKTFSSRRINKLRNTPGTPVWQSRFYDHIIRNADDLNRIRNYIINNPLKHLNHYQYLPVIYHNAI